MGEQRRVLLLGSTGFIGRHASIAFTAAGDEVVEFPRRDSDRLEQVTASAKVDVVVNCAGRTSGSERELAAANVELVRRLVRALSGGGARLVQIGSSAEYGGGHDRFTSEQAATHPIGAYGRSKLAATGMVGAAPMDAVILRVFNPIGDGMSIDTMPGRAASLIRSALARDDSGIRMGDLSGKRDFVDVRDVASAIVAASRVADPPPIVNVGTGHATRSRDLVRMLAAEAGFTGEISEDAAASPRSPGVDRLVADISVARERLGWMPTHSLRDAVSSLWRGSSV